MASDVENLTMSYADLPSIFENNSSSAIELSYNTTESDVNIEKSSRPMFGSFLFADSDPVNTAVFVGSSSSSTRIETTQERLMDVYASSNGNHVSSRIQTTPSVPLPSMDIEDMDEDDFDGIPTRHSLNSMKKDVDELIEQIENLSDEDESFLNGFTDDPQETNGTIPSLFKDIPDIDDLNEHDDDESNTI